MIEVSNINKSYGSLQVLRNVSLQIASGTVTAIVGPSGAGKSTLLQIIGTLDRADSGRVLIHGTDITGMADRRLSAFRNANIGFVFQNHRLLPEFTLVENVALPAMIGGASRREALDRAMRLLRMLGVEGRAQHKPAQLSGGEAQRGAVARALVNEPRVVLADEPSGSLDSANRAQLHALFFELRNQIGATFVVVTHDDSLAADCDTTVRLVDGRIESSL